MFVAFNLCKYHVLVTDYYDDLFSHLSLVFSFAIFRPLSQNSYDQFHYMYFNHTGDVTVTCRVNSFTGSTNGWRKGGIMVRDNTGQRSAHSMLQQTGWGIAHQSRQNENWNSLSVHESYDLAGVWLRMTRVGNVITSYVKRDGEFDYMMYNSVEVTLSDDIKVGIAVTSHDNSQLAELDISHLEITSDVYTLGDSNLVVNEVGDTGTNLRAQQTSEGVWSISAGGDIGVSLIIARVDLLSLSVTYIPYLTCQLDFLLLCTKKTGNCRQLRLLRWVSNGKYYCRNAPREVTEAKQRQQGRSHDPRQSRSR